MHEQYGPASAPLVERGSRPPRSSVVAVLLGGLVVDWGGTLVLPYVILALWLNFEIVLSTSPPSGSPGSLYSRMIMLAMVGCPMSVAGGYVAALWARHRPIPHGLGAGISSAAFSLLLTLLEGNPLLNWHILAAPPLALLGGYLRKLQRPG